MARIGSRDARLLLGTWNVSGLVVVRKHLIRLLTCVSWQARKDRHSGNCTSILFLHALPTNMRFVSHCQTRAFIPCQPPVGDGSGLINKPYQHEHSKYRRERERQRGHDGRRSPLASLHFDDDSHHNLCLVVPAGWGNDRPSQVIYF